MAGLIYRGSTPHFRFTTNQEIDIENVVVLVAQTCSCAHNQWELTPTLDDENNMTFELSKEQTLALTTHSDVKFQLKIESAGEVAYSNVKSRTVIDALDTGNRTSAKVSRSTSSGCGCGCGCELNFTIASEFVVMGEYEVYEGETEVTPSFATQILETANKVMKSDVTVHPIEVSETPNAAGGKTLIIG